MDENEVKAAAERLKNEVKGEAEKAGKEAAEAAVKEVKAAADEAKADVKKLSDTVDEMAIAMARKGGEGEGAKAEDTLVGALAAKSDAIKSRERKQTVTIPLNEKAAVDMVRGNTGASGSQALIGTRAYVAIPNSPTHLRDFMRIVPMKSPYLKYDRELAPQGKPALTAEGTRKPKISFSFESVTATAEKIASHYKLSTELATDAPAFAGSLQGRGIEMTLVEEDTQLIYGTGASGEIQGIYPLASTFDPGEIKVASPQRIDVLRVAAAQVRRSFYRANAILMNPDDVAEMELTKDAEGRYMLPTILTNNIPAIGRVQVIEIDAINPGEFLAGAFDMGVDTYSIDPLTVKVSDSNEDDFVTNKLTVVIEERLLQAVVRPSAFVKGTFDAAITAMAAVA
jgi:HK97 family phage major capsid protein